VAKCLQKKEFIRRSGTYRSSA